MLLRIQFFLIVEKLYKMIDIYDERFELYTCTIQILFEIYIFFFNFEYFYV